MDTRNLDARSQSSSLREGDVASIGALHSLLHLTQGAFADSRPWALIFHAVGVQELEERNPFLFEGGLGLRGGVVGLVVNVRHPLTIWPRRQRARSRDELDAESSSEEVECPRCFSETAFKTFFGKMQNSDTFLDNSPSPRDLLLQREY